MAKCNITILQDVFFTTHHNIYVFRGMPTDWNTQNSKTAVLCYENVLKNWKHFNVQEQTKEDQEEEKSNSWST